MPKKVSLHAVITSIRAKTDGSISFTVSSPELRPEEKTLFFELQNLNIDLLITPLDVEETPDEVQINKDLESKTPSMRLRGSLYRVLEKRLGRKPENEEWEPFYRHAMEAYIADAQRKID